MKPLFTLIFAAVLFTGFSANKLPTGPEKYTVIIDPGHGGSDNGATTETGIHEKDVTLKVAQTLKNMLSDYGFEVIMTREGDEKKSLAERADIAIKNNSDLFLSLHVHSSSEVSTKGMEVYYSEYTPHAERSKGIGGAILKHALESGEKLESRGVKKGGFYLLNTVNCPSVMFNLGYISNEEDLQKMQSDKDLEALSGAILKAVLEARQ